MIRIAALAAALTLAGCDSGRDAELAKLDNQITGKDSDPALTSALEDQILVDPALTQQSNRNAVRPPETPTPGAISARAAAGAGQTFGRRRAHQISGGCGPSSSTGRNGLESFRPPSRCIRRPADGRRGSEAPGCQRKW
jgi:hypothetical protein